MKPQIWDQLKNITADGLINALIKDGWVLHSAGGSSRKVFLKGNKMVSVHYHPHKVFGKDLLTDLLQDIGWTESDLKRLKLIK
jgi:predicted RNA binding protein YcfA (HicA-like mRNA interferase family)